jgi:hypothetical protein
MKSLLKSAVDHEVGATMSALSIRIATLVLGVTIPLAGSTLLSPAAAQADTVGLVSASAASDDACLEIMRGIDPDFSGICENVDVRGPSVINPGPPVDAGRTEAWGRGERERRAGGGAGGGDSSTSTDKDACVALYKTGRAICKAGGALFCSGLGVGITGGNPLAAPVTAFCSQGAATVCDVLYDEKRCETRGGELPPARDRRLPQQQRLAE